MLVYYVSCLFPYPDGSNREDRSRSKLYKMSGLLHKLKHEVHELKDKLEGTKLHDAKIHLTHKKYGNHGSAISALAHVSKGSNIVLTLGLNA